MQNSFAGANPYERAYQREVKLIGVTAHHVTEELDAGPVTNQDVAYASYRDTVEDLKRIGGEIECRVLVRALARPRPGDGRRNTHGGLYLSPPDATQKAPEGS